MLAPSAWPAMLCIWAVHPRGVAQFGSAFGSGPKGRWFKSSHPDHVGAKFALLRFLFCGKGNGARFLAPPFLRKVTASRKASLVNALRPFFVAHQLFAAVAFGGGWVCIYLSTLNISWSFLSGFFYLPFIHFDADFAHPVTFSKLSFALCLRYRSIRG